MITRKQWNDFTDLPAVQWTMFGIGVVLMAVSPLLGALPGPGGIVVFGLGLGMVLKTSMWAKRHYVRFKKKQPKIARWTDWGLMRKSAKRREALRKERKAMGCPPPADERDPAPIDQMLPAPPVDRSIKVRPEGCGD
jgi:hypothetical protein